MGRPRKIIDLKQVEAMASIGSTEEEIAAVLDISTDTMGRRKKDSQAFTKAIKSGREKGKTTLRRWQWQSAERGNVAMLIFLGKHMLGQSDKKNDAEPPPPINQESLDERARRATERARKELANDPAFKVMREGYGNDAEFDDAFKEVVAYEKKQ